MEKQNLIVEFETGRKAELRTPRIRDIQNASAAAVKSGENAINFQLAMQGELLKILLIKINDKVLTPTEKEILDDHLELAEYMALMKEMQELVGNAPIKSRSFAGTSGSK